MPKIMNRLETLQYLKKISSENKRIVVSRYNDGECLLMNNTDRIIANSKSGLISELLRKSIKVKGQFICVNYLKSHNIEKKDRWYDVQSYLIQESQNELYGCSNYNVYDFCYDSSMISKHFYGKVLLVTGLYKQSQNLFKSIGRENIDIYQTPTMNADSKYYEIKDDIEKICNSYDNIVFSCGPLAKVLVSDFIDKCNANLIDFGSVLNAILNMEDQWTMSWTEGINMPEKIKNFIEKVEKET
jgi:hypothetical protein